MSVPRLRWMWVVVVALAGPSALAQTPTSADDSAKAKALYRSATLHYDLGEYREAMDEYKQAYQMRPDPVFLFNIGQCSRRLGDAAGAAKAYRSFLRKLPKAPNRAEVERLLVSLESAIAAKSKPPLDVESPTEEPRKPDPEPAARPLVVAAPSTPATPPPPPRRSSGFAVFGVVAAVVVAGAAVGVGLGVGLQPRSMPPETNLGTMSIRF